MTWLYKWKSSTNMSSQVPLTNQKPDPFSVFFMNHVFWMVNLQLPHWKCSCCCFWWAETQKWRRCPVHQSWNPQSIARPNSASKMEDGRWDSNTFWKLNSRCSRCFRDTYGDRNCTSIHYMYEFLTHLYISQLYASCIFMYCKALSKSLTMIPTIGDSWHLVIV